MSVLRCQDHQQKWKNILRACRYCLKCKLRRENVKGCTAISSLQSSQSSRSLRDIGRIARAFGVWHGAPLLLSTVDAIKKLLSEAYRHLNSRASLSELPQELLALVFNEVVAAHKPETPISFPALSSDGNRPTLRALKVISQVCRLWRDVAFGTPALWTDVDSRSYPHDELYNVLQRSYALPISLFLHKASELEESAETGTRQVHSSSLLQRMASRLHRVDLDVEEPRPPILEKLLSFNGSTVHCLTISSTFSELMYGALDNVTHVIPILQGQVDSLQALAIVPSIGWIPANHFPSLTHLYISFLSGYVQSPDPQDILFLLHNTPRLQILYLHHLASRDTPSTNEPWRSDSSQPIKLQHLRSLVFAYCAYEPAVDILCELSLPQATLVRLDDTYIPYDHYPDTLPSSIGPLKRIDAMEIAVTDNSFFLVAEGDSSGFWLRMRTFQDIDLDPWVSHLHIPIPFGTLVTLRLDARDSHVFTLLQHAVQLSDLSVALSLGWEDGPGFERTLPPLVRTLCSLLSCSQPIVCPSLRSLTLQWPKGMSSFEDLGVPDVISMLSTRATLGQPVARLVVQANSAHIHAESVQSSFFAAQLAQLAEHVEEYEECADWNVDVCASELRAMWNVEGTEDYWTLDEMQRARSMPLGRPSPRASRPWR
ncbi:hypothetical protein V8D89_008835 [Ganoderma adspersum]